ncbi:hypothetical protein PVAND_011193 [Polypedilum vanderplanki]|uniref:Gamma-interferon inducible lysosomal thiol reductase n=1 Tax=Polypedilum vanderplanki TaxID=319348 RepID=A0A9J6CHU9_POLVA|nr:hypothetical protein PVAND_011193 [Polypedilum vanderplanki]
MDVRNKILTLFAVVLLSTVNYICGQNYNDKLHIDIHYESRCPDSRNFIKNQLVPAYSKIKDKVVLNYIPFGKAYSYNSNNRVRFSCQHGERECDGNVFQACVLDFIGVENQDSQLSFVACAMDFSKNPFNCAQNMGIDLIKINECTNGEKGIQLQIDAEKYSTPHIRRSGFVPTITYNNKYNSIDFWDSLDDFESVVTQKLGNL